MKTIEQASKKYGQKVSPHSSWTARNAEISFTAGVEFAQSWIDIKEEIPLIGEWVTCKKNDSYHTMRIRDEFGLKIMKINFTHWRPVERK